MKQVILHFRTFPKSISHFLKSLLAEQPFVNDSGIWRTVSAIHLHSVRIGVDENRKGFLLTGDGFCLYVTEVPIYEIKLKLAESMTHDLISTL